jgi:RNA polymerase sigma-70 factor, ECF subfamily
MVVAERMSLAKALQLLARRRDPEAWSALVEQLASDVYRLCARLTGDASVADDAVQETFLIVRDKADRFQRVSSDVNNDVRRWVMRIAINVSLKIVRTRTRATQREQAFARTRSEHAVSTAEDDVAEREHADLLRVALAELPESTRAAIVMHHLSGSSFQDIARELRCPVGTAKARVHRGLQSMRGSLAKAGVGISAALLLTQLRGLSCAEASLSSAVSVCHGLAKSPLQASINGLPSAVMKGVPMFAKIAAGLVAVASIGYAPFLFAQEKPAPQPAAVAAAKIPQPTEISDANGLALIIVPNLKAAFAQVEQAYETVAPGQKLPSLAQQLGAMLGDPQLANLAANPVMIAIGQGSPYPTVAVLLPCKNPQAYVDAVARLGMTGKVMGELAVLAQTPDGIIAGEKCLTQYADIAKAPPRVSARLVMAPDRVATTYGPLMKVMLSQVAQQMGPSLRGGAALCLAASFEVADDLSSAQTDFTFSGSTIIVEHISAATDDSELAKALSAPLVATQPSAASRLSNEPNMVAINGRVNYETTGRYSSYLFAELAKLPEAKDLITPTFIEEFQQTSEVETGDLALRIPLSAKHLTFDMVFGCNNAVKAEEITDHMIKQFVSGNALLAQRGVSLKTTKHARTIAGVPVDRFEYEIDEAKAGKEAAIMRASLPTYEIAYGKDFLYQANAANIDAMVTGKNAGLVTRAEKFLPSGRDGYFDVNVGAYFGMIFASSGRISRDNPLFAELAKTEPMVGAWTCDAGRMRIECKIPLDSFSKFMQVVRGAPDSPKAEDDTF